MLPFHLVLFTSVWLQAQNYLSDVNMTTFYTRSYGRPNYLCVPFLFETNYINLQDKNLKFLYSNHKWIDTSISGSPGSRTWALQLATLSIHLPFTTVNLKLILPTDTDLTTYFLVAFLKPNYSLFQIKMEHRGNWVSHKNVCKMLPYWHHWENFCACNRTDVNKTRWNGNCVFHFYLKQTI